MSAVPPGSGPGRVRDAIFLAAILTLSFVLYVPGLGFYSDDWAFCGSVVTADERSVIGSVRALVPHELAKRPVQWLYDAVLFGFLEDRPLGYHLAGSAVLLAGALLLYLLLREQGTPRAVALALPLVYGLLPHYSTDRFWIAAAQVSLSATFYFLSTWAQLLSCRREGKARTGWNGLAVGSLLISALAYEVMLPLFAVNAVAAGTHRHAGRKPNRPLAVGLVLALVGAATFKVLVTPRMAAGEAILAQSLRSCLGAFSLHPRPYGLNVWYALSTGYGLYGAGLPWTALSCLLRYPSAPVAIAGAVVALAVTWYFERLTRSEPSSLPRAATSRRLLAGGVAVFFLSYSLFLVTGGLQLTPTGLANRTAIAAAIGVAMSMLGAIGLLASLSGRFQRVVFCGLLSLVCGGGFVVVNTLASFWRDAQVEQRAILAAIGRRFPSAPRDRVLLLDGACPFLGPAPVFESSWDLAGALRTRYRDGGIRADVVKPNLRIGEDSVSTFFFGEESRYPYGQFFVFDARSGLVVEPHDRAEAERYFGEVSPSFRGGCPPSADGLGAPVF